MTAEDRYNQAMRKARIIARRNLERFMRGEIMVCPALDERRALIAEIERAYQSGLSDGMRRAAA